MRFFKPLPHFIPWVKQTAGDLPVIDCGCGYGDLVREMCDASIMALGVDHRYQLFDEPVPEDLTARIIPLDAIGHPLIRNNPSFLLVCRPCHNGFPTQIAASKHPNSPFYYVGFEKNLHFDLQGLKTVKVPIGFVGEDKEELFQILPQS